MKLLWFFLILLLPFSPVKQQRFVSPGGSYENNTEYRVYLLLELAPNQKFQNQSSHVFDVLRPQDMPTYFAEVRERMKIDSLNARLQQLQGRIDSLDEKLKGLK